MPPFSGIALYCREAAIKTRILVAGVARTERDG